MNTIVSFVLKIFKIPALTLASILGVVQTALKFIKEIITAIINILFPLFPDDGSFEKTVKKIRDIVNKVDEVVEKIKGYLI